jgi:hypothetical protein
MSMTTSVRVPMPGVTAQRLRSAQDTQRWAGWAIGRCMDPTPFPHLFPPDHREKLLKHAQAAQRAAGETIEECLTR